ncbi:thiamine-monophosphate kinase [Desulfobaculum xiamenense]|uniref:Thiamine-monophosphate kinase n=1 Tax=Desulfobaculum xiamenense TaxID=995050 RepID=A0A846QWH6_9BACT|nr:thiamine-phosphate kinase [Desulfobaculum xiamenense]NJB68969.1 thiamine-monophosphate kinase [Desulfobaculum xiamenense]
MIHRPPASEEDFLNLIDRHFATAHPHMRLGRGDDCVRLACPQDMVLSTDLFLEDVHFRRSYFSPADIGHKALAVNISDIAGMGCRPLGFSLGLVIPDDPTLTTAFWNDLLGGMGALAHTHDIPLTGGDLSRGPYLGFSVTVWGTPGPTGRVLTRNTCRPGDAILACGPIGLARAGLFALEELGPEAIALVPHAIRAHLRPTPRVADGLALADIPGVHGAMDLSDGLARDLARLTGPGLGADLTLTESALHPDLIAHCTRTGQPALPFAVLGGEDYALIATAAPDSVPDILARIPQATRIGTVAATPGITVNGQPFDHTGFDHFATHE